MLVRTKNPDYKSRPAFFPRFIASTATAISQNFLLGQWIDALSKRLQEHPLHPSITSPNFVNDFKQIVFPNTTNFREIMASLSHGLKISTAYRIMRFNMVFGVQPIVKDALDKYARRRIEPYTGVNYCGPVLEAGAGFVTCVLMGKILFPLDTIKVRMQTQNLSFRQSIAMGNFYCAANIAKVRNGIAGGTLFGGSAFVRKYGFGLDNPQDASLQQETIAVTIAAILATIFNNSTDILKTRVQNAGGTKACGQIAKEIWQKEGAKGLFFRGLGPRLFTVAPSTVFCMVAVNQITKSVNSLSELGFFSAQKALSKTEGIQQVEKETDEEQDEFKQPCTHRI
jgi:hypothetical protein